MKRMFAAIALFLAGSILAAAQKPSTPPPVISPLLCNYESHDGIIAISCAMPNQATTIYGMSFTIHVNNVQTTCGYITSTNSGNNGATHSQTCNFPTTAIPPVGKPVPVVPAPAPKPINPIL